MKKEVMKLFALWFGNQNQSVFPSQIEVSFSIIGIDQPSTSLKTWFSTLPVTSLYWPNTSRPSREGIPACKMSIAEEMKK